MHCLTAKTHVLNVFFLLEVLNEDAYLFLIKKFVLYHLKITYDF